MSRVHDLFAPGPLTLPLAGGTCLRLTPFRDSAHVALTVHDDHGRELGGIVLGAGRARLLARWLERAADDCESAPEGGTGTPSFLVRQRG